MFATVCHLFVGDIIPISKKTNSIADSGGIFDPRTQPKTAAFWAAYPSAHLSLAVCSAMCIVRWVLRFLVGFSAASAQDFGFPADASDSCNDSCQADSVPLIQLGRPEKGCADELWARAAEAIKGFKSSLSAFAALELLQRRQLFEARQLLKLPRPGISFP